MSSPTTLSSSSSSLSSRSAFSSSNASSAWLCVLFVCVLVALPLCVSGACNPCVSGGCDGLDLSSITKEFTVSGEDYSTYFFMMCQDDSKCGGQVCKKTEIGTYSLGNKANSQWALTSSSGDISQGAVLNVGGGNDQWDGCDPASSTVNVTCGSGDDTLQATQENRNCKWLFTFNSKYVCGLPKGGGSGGAGHGLSGGSIFLILFFVGGFVYFVGGILFNKYRRGLSGSEMIPNISFWRDLPGLVRDGCMFSFNKVRGLCGGARTGSLLSKGTGSTYETI